MQVFKRLSEPLQKFLGFVGASLTGITAVFTATGFLAERARLTMLGLPSTTFDLQQYLETGARFLAFLPLYLGMALYYTLLGLVTGTFYWLEDLLGLFPAAFVFFVAVSGLLAVLVLYVRHKWKTFVASQAKRPPKDDTSEDAPEAAQAQEAAEAQEAAQAQEEAPATRTVRDTLLVRFLGRNLAWVLFPFLLIQFLGAYQLTQALEISNLLFDPDLAASEIPHTEFSIVQTETLRDWIVERKAIQAAQYVGWLFLITLLTAWALHRMRELFRKSGREDLPFWQVTWFAGSLLLLVTQVTLLPINYGILLTSNRFVEVSLVYTGAEEAPGARPAGDRLRLLHETGGGYYLYAPAQRKVWYVLRSDVKSIEHHRMVDVLQR